MFSEGQSSKTGPAQRQRLAWLSVTNTTHAPQTVTVSLLGGGAEVTRTVTVPARGREPFELASLFALTSDRNFGVEVVCASSCGAALVIWDGNYANPVVSAPQVECRDEPNATQQGGAR